MSLTNSHIRWRLAAVMLTVGALTAACSAGGTPEGSIVTTQPSDGAALLTVDSPQPGDVFVSSQVIRGLTSAEPVGYRLSAGGNVLVQGTATVVGDQFEVEVEFANTCCIEMLLEVFHVDAGGLSLTIPVAYPEPESNQTSDPADLLLVFAEAWEAANWDRMRSIATDSVVATAIEWSIEGGDVGIDRDNIATVLDNGWFLYVPPEGYALIFSIGYDTTESGLAVTELIFGGDAG